MRVLITGIAGFVGRHLADYLSDKKEVEIFGTCRRSKPAALRGARVRLVTCDLLDESAIARALKACKPERIFHLAAQASVAESWTSPRQTFEQNVFGTMKLLDAVRWARLDPKILVAGSAEEYGPLGAAYAGEDAPMRPLKPCAVSKAAQDLLVYQYFRTFRLKIVRTRAFNHSGPGQSDRFAASNFARQVALIEAGLQKPAVRVGNLSTIRDFIDVRDVVRAYWLALEKGAAGEAYNVCSGKGRRIREILDFYRLESVVKFRVERDRARLRPVDVPRLVGDPRKFKSRTGWRPLISFEKMLADLLDYWRYNIRLQPLNDGKE